MYNKILVPLDGSSAAEAILPHTVWLAKALESRIVLLTVRDHSELEDGDWPFRRSRGGVQTVERKADASLKHYVPRAADELEAVGMERYVARVADELAASGVDAEPYVVSGDVPDEIIGRARSHGCDLIAMSTHGHSGLRRGFWAASPTP